MVPNLSKHDPSQAPSPISLPSRPPCACTLLPYDLPLTLTPLRKLVRGVCNNHLRFYRNQVKDSEMVKGHTLADESEIDFYLRDKRAKVGLIDGIKL